MNKVSLNLMWFKYVFKSILYKIIDIFKYLKLYLPVSYKVWVKSIWVKSIIKHELILLIRINRINLSNAKQINRIIEEHSIKMKYIQF